MPVVRGGDHSGCNAQDDKTVFGFRTGPLACALARVAKTPAPLLPWLAYEHNQAVIGTSEIGDPSTVVDCAALHPTSSMGGSAGRFRFAAGHGYCWVLSAPM